MIGPDLVVTSGSAAQADDASVRAAAADAVINVFMA
jgi:hypothetical protein